MSPLAPESSGSGVSPTTPTPSQGVCLEMHHKQPGFSRETEREKKGEKGRDKGEKEGERPRMNSTFEERRGGGKKKEKFP